MATMVESSPVLHLWFGRMEIGLESRTCFNPLSSIESSCHWFWQISRFEFLKSSPPSSRLLQVEKTSDLSSMQYAVEDWLSELLHPEFSQICSHMVSSPQYVGVVLRLSVFLY